MKPADILKEMAFPLTDMVVLLALVSFVLLSMLAKAAGLLGIWLAVLLLPALYRYLLLLLETRAKGRSTPVAGIELFNLVDNFWSLTPLVLYAIAIWGGILLAKYVSLLAASLLALVFVTVLPASLAVLAVTYSPFESLNPAAIWRLMRACGWDYAAILLVLLLTACLTSMLARINLPTVVTAALSFYELFLLFTFTGAVLFANGIQFQIDIPDAVEVGGDVVAGSRVKARQQVLTHAYGFFSRDNRAGGLAHVQSAIQEEPDQDEAYRWYFDRMLEWESRGPALMLAQVLLSRLLRQKRETDALKLMTRCLLVDAAFKPLPADRQAALAAAERYRRDDLIESFAR